MLDRPCDVHYTSHGASIAVPFDLNQGGGGLGLANKLNEVAAASQHKLLGCRMAQLMGGLPKEDAEALQSAFASPASTRSIHAVLESEGLTIDRATVAAHRKGFCRCKETSND